MKGEDQEDEGQDDENQIDDSQKDVDGTLERNGADAVGGD